ncbi:hypothetical protein niasHT_033274 [Heterodera trifolii]|uniref:Protein kinase domain-containing protein n=1 Tax=Heterodera trifolii TaxID=157864 RepID=A0ABD2I9E5_9BILA
MDGEKPKVFIGYFTAADGAIRCVAVKSVNRTEAASSLFRNSIRLMAKIYEKFEKEQRKHLVEIIDTGYTIPHMKGIVIMEMGDESLHQRLKSGRPPAFGENDSDLMSAIENMAQPLVEFHEIAIHMDVNPRNYLYVSENGHLLLKLIDFEGSQLLRGNLDKNECVPIGEHAFTPEYTGPEYYGEHGGREISTKFDIWSVGIIVFEILLGHLRAEQREGPMKEDDLKAKLFAIGNLFLGFTRNNPFGSPGELKNLPIDYSKREWFEQNINAMETVLQLWQKFPKTALLVTVMAREIL